MLVYRYANVLRLRASRFANFRAGTAFACYTAVRGTSWAVRTRRSWTTSGGKATRRFFRHVKCT